jgi:hypothetical protein
MEINIDKIWEILNHEDEDYLIEIKKIIKICEESYPNDYWKELYDVSWNSIVEQLDSCFSPQVDEIINNDIVGLYFGITTVALTNGDSSFALEIGGTKKYDSTDLQYKWIFDLSWKGTYLICDAFYQIYLLANQKDGLGNNIEWPFGLAIVKYGISTLIKRYEKMNIFKNKIGIVVGFHDGDMIKIRGINE